MSEAKAKVLEHLKMVPDDITSETEILNRLYMLLRLEHSKERVEVEGTLTDDELAAHFAEKREQTQRSLCN
ncbi:hypothetical protein [Anaerocolumna chitinilytica]|uniref:Uncharacterized protein n=1 Tax=Anaerocolumna chitinilytica TaxID=1727145 RepID=A0A7I8DIU2_9FIRM|nr:hypothetical protein [Anaerocolumna chitinilytica]BCJ98408.1 hypothetical protein bsdcttw_14490 [Anaerocolumna chitinilytica]